MQISVDLSDSDPNASTATAEVTDTGPQTDPVAGGAAAGTGQSRAELPVDGVCAAATTRARQAALEVAGTGQVGDHIAVVAEGERLVSHLFECLSPGYRGWRWSVTLSRAPRARSATVCEVVLLPGPSSVLAPPWLPWSDRVAPGDLGPKDQLAYRSDDPNLEPGYTVTDEEDEDRLAVWELGLGRARVLSPTGRAELARRWYSSDHGPTSDEAVHAQAACSTCGYYLPLAGSLRSLFGACGNEWSPADGRVVSADHGCGAHSETDIDRPVPESLPSLILDETGAEAVVVPPRPAGEPEAPSEVETPSGVETPAEVEAPAEPAD